MTRYGRRRIGASTLERQNREGRTSDPVQRRRGTLLERSSAILEVMKTQIRVALGIVFAFLACAGANHSSTALAATTHIRDTTISVADLPMYPGATKVGKNQILSRCGHTVISANYSVGAAMKTVSDWYSHRIPGFRIQREVSSGSVHMTAISFIERNGLRGVSIIHMTSSHGDQPVGIGLEHYKPALTAQDIARMRAANVSGSAARRQFAATMKGKCPRNGF